MRQILILIYKHSLRHNILQQYGAKMIVLLALIQLLPLSVVCLSLTKNSQQQSCDKTRRVFNETYGEISDGPSGSNYTQDSHCEWLIRAQNNSQFITLIFRSMGTECSYDYIFIYDGDSFRSPLLGSFSGKTEPQRVMASSGSMLVLLYSDTNYVLEGFKAEFSVTNCPNNCTGHGKCVEHLCECDINWIGNDCSQDACPDNCGREENRGECVNARCVCSSNYSGQACSLHKTIPEPNEWHWLSNSKNGLTPRATHTAVYYAPTDSLYVFGGYNLNKVLSSLNIYRFEKSLWENEWGVQLGSEEMQSMTTINGRARQGTLFTDGISGTVGLGKEPNFFNNFIFSLTDNRTGPFGAVYGNNSRPAGRYGHAAAAVTDGFVIFGGKLASGRLVADLWLFNISENGGTWSERAKKSSFKPPPLTRHTLTLASEYLYVFGGALENGEFSSSLFRIKLNSNSNVEQWEQVIPRGGKMLDLRVVAHTTSYHRHTNSLIVYGGVVAGVARFSKLSDRMFSFQLDYLHWTEIMYPRTPLRDAFIPRERAFHTTTINGNYLIVFGGYSHRHNKEEICYDNQMYLYHLGCHNWITQDVLGGSRKSRYPKQQGVFAHAAALRKGKTLFLVGGYHGNVNGDLLAYTLPPKLIVENEDTFEPEAACPKHSSVSECLSDPECGWCSADSVCYGRTIGANCTTNLQTTRCRGVCPALGDCHSCLIHGSAKTASFRSIANKLGLDQCTWCVQNARCHHKDDNYGVCGEDTPSQNPGWWGPKGTEIMKPEQCTRMDSRPGLTFLKYLDPINWSMPDSVMIVNATMVDFIVPSSTTHTEQSFHGQVVARLLGFIRPPLVWEAAGEKLRACASYSQAVLRVASTDATNSNLKKKLFPVIVANISANQTTCELAQWRNLEPKFRVMVDFQAKRSNASIQSQQLSKMGLQHCESNQENAKAFTFEYLEPYSNGTCHAYTNCLHCLSDSLCGWCEITNECLSRQEKEREMCREGSNWRYLTVQPSQCPNCSNYISCEQCIEVGQCEWWPEDARCSRKGRSATAVTDLDQCPVPCYLRENCSSCLNERGRCVWCEATGECFSFSVYTSEYQFGLCREWLDQTIPIGMSQPLDSVQHSTQSTQQCKSCSSHQNCSNCLRSLNCGWCYDSDNPIEGICIQGDFNRSDFDCKVALNITEEKARWSYAQCPDVDECELGLHDCHEQAECSNTHGSFTCRCKKGFLGDGVRNCVQTCYETCIRGYCSGGPEYKCQCDLGWTGIDCSQNCQCNNHSTCLQGVGKCDKCMNWTEGSNCERCSAGSFGNATSDLGCQPCDCNGHGNEALGICDSQTGECYCQDNTEGLKCQVCNRNFYGDPKAGGQCYFQCEARGVLTNVGTEGIGSYQSYRPVRGGTEARECLWIISPRGKHGVELKNSIIQFEIEPHEMNVTCEQNAVYVYDGLPDLTGATLQRQLVAVFCSEDKSPWITEARSGHLTVHFKQGRPNQGFNAVYSVLSCSSKTCQRPYVCLEDRCVCPKGFTGPRCLLRICPSDCYAESKQGICDVGYGRCICMFGYGGADCSRLIKPSNIVFTELFNSYLISDSFEHLRKTLPRFGHSLVADRRGSLWMFGGYSLSHGPLNDIRQFDTKNNTWMQVTVDSSPEDRMPLGRYFHAAEIILSKQAIYIYGGLSRNQSGHRVLDDFWQFGLQTQRWSIVNQKGFKPPPLAGHSMTLVKDADKEVLLIIGGFSVTSGMSNNIWMFDLSSNSWSKILATGAKPIGVFGHSTVCHPTKQVLYLFGGIVYPGEKTKVSNKLYALNFKNFKWTEIPVFINRPTDYVPQARYLHSAVTTDSYMLIFGGRFRSGIMEETMIAYVYKCNQWIRLSGDVEIIGDTFGQTYAQAMTQDPEYDAFYAVGGWDGSSYSRVTRISMPTDLCELWSSSKYICRQYMGCSFCAIKTVEDYNSHCYSVGNSDVCDAQNGTLSFNNGAPCDDDWLSKRNCTLFDTCTKCLASYPFHTEDHPICQWCPHCGARGKCLPYESAECEAPGRTCASDKTAIQTLDNCPADSCAASDCESCNSLPNCSWSFQGKNSRCQYRNSTDGNRKPSVCPNYCHTHTSCSNCLSERSSEGGWSDCRWSTQLGECISPSYQPLYCAGSICGLVLEPSDIGHCPEPCDSFLQCGTCLRRAHCGWCSRFGTEGDGICTEGSLDSPVVYPASSTCDVIYRLKKNVSGVHPSDRFSWNYLKCPPENECTNSHHNCNVHSETCVDLLHGYECQCAEGYRANSSGSCIPVCKQGCVRGSCVEPNKCDCDFGYVGTNCSIQCQCNGHSNCEGPDQLDKCLECGNNTLGARCEKCKPFFVRDPRNNGACIPCSEYCYGHTDMCVSRDMEATVRNMSFSDLSKMLVEGPQSDAVCLRCDNKTDGDRCDTCIIGHFRGVSLASDPCRPCQCHGHGDMCDPVTGEKCNCGNNTESDNTCSAKGKNLAYSCWSMQCTKCKDTYSGHPSNGHQCYKHITVDSRMCFDAKIIDECKIKPQALQPGQTVFFVIQPRYMNVDIRFIVDVTLGELDFYMSPNDETFVVFPNNTSGYHDIYLDNRYSWHHDIIDQDSMDSFNIHPLNVNGNYSDISVEPPVHILSQSHCRMDTEKYFYVKDKIAKDLITYVTLQKCNSLLRVFGLKNRLVVTLPHTVHSLGQTKFYIALRARSESTASYGLVFFRQDQLHIHLFVFFSVFFSCFFLFLAICVLAWKAKQAADMRRARRRHVVEMLHMAKRPFGRINLSLEIPSETPASHRKRGRIKQHTTQQILQQDIAPVALEPTSDNVAAVGTVFVRLPGKQKSQVTLALASSLVILSRSHTTYGRAFHRRRGSSHYQAQHFQQQLQQQQGQHPVQAMFVDLPQEQVPLEPLNRMH